MPWHALLVLYSQPGALTVFYSAAKGHIDNTRNYEHLANLIKILSDEGMKPFSSANDLRCVVGFTLCRLIISRNHSHLNIYPIC